MKTYYIAIVFVSGKEVELISTLSDEEINIVNTEFESTAALNLISSFKIEELPLPNLGLIDLIEDEEV